MTKASGEVIAKARKEGEGKLIIGSNGLLFIVYLLILPIGKVAFGEPITASFRTDKKDCWHKCWRHAAGHIVGPPNPPDEISPGYLMNLLAK